MSARAEVYTGGVYRLTMRGPAQPVVVQKPPKPHTPDALSPQALAAWRHMRDAGGFWAPQELGRVMLPELPCTRSAQVASRWVSALLTRRHVVLNPNHIRHKSYGVTARCIPPAGESLDPVEQPKTQGFEQ